MGDMTKVRYVPGLGRAAHKLLANIEHTSRRLPGTPETRRVMRFAHGTVSPFSLPFLPTKGTI
eukprot:8168464-Pyramimonas_sp.AAC.1